MSELLSREIRANFSTSRLLPRSARASGGVGERRSAMTGPGMEFADFRPYQPGDDTRYLDRHVFARLGLHVIREYSLDRQLEVTVFVDCSGSMAAEDGVKARRAKELAAALSFVTLVGGDRIRLAVLGEAKVERSPPITSDTGLRQALAWLEAVPSVGHVAMAKAASDSARMHRDGILLVISDWLTQDAVLAIRTWGRLWEELVAIQILSHSELKPAWLASGTLVQDIETEEEVQVEGDDLARRYEIEIRAWQAELATEVRRHGGQWFSFTSSASVGDALQELRRGRLLL